MLEMPAVHVAVLVGASLLLFIVNARLFVHVRRWRRERGVPWWIEARANGCRLWHVAAALLVAQVMKVGIDEWPTVSRVRGVTLEERTRDFCFLVFVVGSQVVCVSAVAVTFRRWRREDRRHAPPPTAPTPVPVAGREIAMTILTLLGWAVVVGWDWAREIGP